MPENLDLSLPDPGSLQRGRFTYFPVVPGKLEFAIEVRRTILRDKPQVIAIELPTTLRDSYLRAVERLPEMSVILYNDEHEEDRAIYVPVEPADPFTEAVRSGREIGAEIVFADPDAGERPHLPDQYPDSYALRHIPLEKYVEAYRLWPQPRSEQIAAHASGIAWKLQGCDPLANVLVVISLNLLDPVLDAMESPQAQPMARLRRRGVQVLNPHPECLAEITTSTRTCRTATSSFAARWTTPASWSGGTCSSPYFERRKRRTKRTPASAWRTGSGGFSDVIRAISRS
jgi:hypothetical protein